MQSTPAVFFAPSMSAMSTPCISTPAVFQHESYPWAMKTPEPSPMCMSMAPFCGVHAGALPSAEPVVSREFLRSLCEPFFEEMITSLQQASQEHQRQTGVVGIPQSVFETTKDTFFQSAFSSILATRNHQTHFGPTPDDESTEADDLGAFSTLFSGPSSEGRDSEASSPVVQVPIPRDDSEASDPEKNIMVCRHWRSKGFCRMQGDCKFLHPEHKRGVTASKVGNGGVNMDRVACPGTSTSLSLCSMMGLEGQGAPPVLPRRTKRGGRGKTLRTQGHSQCAEDHHHVHSPFVSIA